MTVAINVTGLSTVGLALTMKATVSPADGGATVTVWLAVADTWLASVTVKVTVTSPDAV